MKLYHGSNIETNFTDPEESIVVDLEYGKALAYFTDCMDSAIRYADMFASNEGGMPYVYECSVDIGEPFCCEQYYTTDRLVELLQGVSNLRDFAHGIGILNSFSDEYAVMSSLKMGRLKLTGKQVFDGLTSAFAGNPTTALQHILNIGYGSLKYKADRAGMKPHTIYLIDDPQQIQVLSKKVVKNVNVYDGGTYDSRLSDDDYTAKGEEKMLMQYLRTVSECAEEIMSDIEMGVAVPSWAKKKIILSEDYLDAVRDYMNSKADK